MKDKIINIILLIMIVMQGLVICLGVDLINDKNAYINGLQSDRNICEGKIDTIIQDHAIIEHELKEYKRVYGDIDG